MKYIVFDIETKNTFNDVLSENPADLDLSVLSIYTNWDNKTQSFEDFELDKALSIFKQADFMVGFNSNHFDIPILNKYFNQGLNGVKSIDLLEEIKKVIGKRIKLDNVAKSTLGISKSGNGLDAIKWWNEGKIEKIKEYCEQDVLVTKQVFEYVLLNKKLYANDKLGKKVEIPIHLDLEIRNKNTENQSLFSF